MDIIQINQLSKRYSDNLVLKNIDLNIQQGDFFALLGYNGAGKTTLISILTNLVNKTGGTVLINGINIETDFAQARTYIGVVPQEFNFDIFAKVQDIVITQAGYYGIPRQQALKNSQHYLKQLGLWDKREAKAKELSGGMKRRLMIARALVHEPKILILDEPTAGVDVELRKSMWEFIGDLNKSGTTILLTTHYLEEVEALCNKVAIINKGNIVKNTSVKQLLKQLDEEKIILTIDQEVSKVPLQLQDLFQAEKREENEIEVTIQNNQTLNELFSLLDSLGIKVISFRNKTNRLEQLFLNITQ